MFCMGILENQNLQYFDFIYEEKELNYALKRVLKRHLRGHLEGSILQY